MKKFFLIFCVVVMVIAAFMVGKNWSKIEAQKAEKAETAAIEAPAEVPAETAEAPAETTETAETAEAPADAAEAETADVEVSPTPEPLPSVVLDFEKLYALHAPEDVVMKVNGKDVTWADYFYCLYNQGSRISSTLQQMQAYYGATTKWDDAIDEEGTQTVAQLAVANSVEMFKQQQAVADYAAEKKITLTPEDEEKLNEEVDTYFKQALGEDVTDEQIEELVSGMYLTREKFNEINKLSAMYDRGFVKQYGEHGEKISQLKAVKYLEDNEYLAASHILFMTVDASTYAALDDDAKAEKKALAEKTLEELKAIEDKDERVARFKELKEEYCEDTGKVSYPDGYLFTPGTMVTEFEDAVKALGDYEISDLVESTYGYHIIMRLPLDPNMPIEYESDGTPVTARSKVAEKEYTEKVQKLMDEMVVEYVNGYEEPNLAEFVK